MYKIYIDEKVLHKFIYQVVLYIPSPPPEMGLGLGLGLGSGCGSEPTWMIGIDQIYDEQVYLHRGAVHVRGNPMDGRRETGQYGVSDENGVFARWTEWQLTRVSTNAGYGGRAGVQPRGPPCTPFAEGRRASAISSIER